MTEWMTDNRRTALRAICDTVVPSIARTDDATGFWARKSTDVGTDQAIIGVLATMPAEQRDGLLGLVDVLGAQGIVHASPLSREQLLSRTALLGPMAAIGVGALTKLILFLTYGQPDPATGQNPMWKEFGYPGPVSMPPQKPKPISPVVPAGDVTINADVVVVGSGAGGGVIAGKLAAGGPEGRRARGRRLLQRGRLQPARAVGLPEHLLARRADADGRHERHAQAGRHPRRRHVRSTGPTACAPGPGCASSGRASTASKASTARTTIGTSTRSRSASASTTIAPNSTDRTSASRTEPSKLGWAFRRSSRNADPATYDPVSAGYHGLRRPVGLQARNDEDLSAGRVRRRRRHRRALPRQQGARRRRARGGRRGDLRRSGDRRHGQGDRARPADRRRRRLAGIAGAAACALASAARRSAKICGCILSP